MWIILCWRGPWRAAQAAESSQHESSSLRFDTCRRDNWPPLFDLGHVKGSEPLRRLLLAWRDLRPEISNALSHGSIGECFHNGRVQACDGCLRRPLGDPDAMP